MSRYPDITCRLENCATGAEQDQPAHVLAGGQVDDARTHPRHFTLRDRIHIARALHAHGLGDLRLPGITSGTVCHGKAHGCTCPDCTTTKKVAPPSPAQPWEAKAPRHQQEAA